MSFRVHTRAKLIQMSLRTGSLARIKRRMLHTGRAYKLATLLSSQFDCSVDSGHRAETRVRPATRIAFRYRALRRCKIRVS